MLREIGRRVLSSVYEQFVTKAKKKHGDLYQYERSVYTGAFDLIYVTCPKHGDFRIVASVHTSQGQGCPTCSQERRKGVEWDTETLRSFVAKFDRSKAVNKASTSAYLALLAHPERYAMTRHFKQMLKGFYSVREHCIETVSSMKTVLEWQRCSMQKLEKDWKGKPWTHEIEALLDKLERGKRPDGYWHNTQNCIDYLKRFETRHDMWNDRIAGMVATKLRMRGEKHVIDEIFGLAVGHRDKKVVYVFGNELTKEAYVGQSFDPVGRFAEHCTRKLKDESNRIAVQNLAIAVMENVNGSFHAIIGKDNELADIDKAETWNWFSSDEICSAEDQWIETLKSRGFTMLNSIAVGGQGGSSLKYEVNELIAEAKKFKKPSDLEKANPSVYNRLRFYSKNYFPTLMEKACAHMIKRGSADYEKQREEQILNSLTKCKNYAAFRLKPSGLNSADYNYAASRPELIKKVKEYFHNTGHH